MMKPDLSLVLQALFCVYAALLFASPALGAPTPITMSKPGGEVEGQFGDSKPINHGHNYGVGIGKGYKWQYKGGHGVGWSVGCKLGCCAYFVGKCKYCCQTLQEAQAYYFNNNQPNP